MMFCMRPLRLVSLAVALGLLGASAVRALPACSPYEDPCRLVAERVLLPRPGAGVWSLEERVDGTLIVTSALRATLRDGGALPYPGRFDFVHLDASGAEIERRSALVPTELVTRVGSSDGVGVVWLPGGALVHWVEVENRTEPNGENVVRSRIRVSFVTARIPKPVPPPLPVDLVSCERCTLRLDSSITADGALLVYARTDITAAARGGDGTFSFAAFDGQGALRASGPLPWAGVGSSFRLQPTRTGTLVVAGTRAGRMGPDGALLDGPFPLPSSGAVLAARPEHDLAAAWAAGNLDGGGAPTGMGLDIWVAHYTGSSLGQPRRATSASGPRAVAFDEAQGFGVLSVEGKVSYLSWLLPNGDKRGGDVRMGDDEGAHYLRFDGPRLLDVTSTSQGIVEREVQCVR